MHTFTDTRIFIMIKRTPLKRYTPLKRSSKPILKKTPVKKQTSKEKTVKNKLSALKKEIELEAIQNNEYYCTGCGKTQAGLDKSHILPVGTHKHLEVVKENIQLMCRSCHIIWESAPLKLKLDLLCFKNNINLIKKLDYSKYLFIVNEIDNLNIKL